MAPAAVDALVATGLVDRHAHGVAFRHEIARSAVLGAVTPGSEPALHETMIAALEATGADASALTHHAVAAGDPPRILRYAAAAASRASPIRCWTRSGPPGSPAEAAGRDQGLDIAGPLGAVTGSPGLIPMTGPRVPANRCPEPKEGRALNVLAQNTVLTLFLVIAAGSLFGVIPFGPIRFGPAGALFVGLFLGAFDDRLGQGTELVRTLGLALFVYTIGLSSGPTLIRTFRRQAPMMLASAAVLAVIAAMAVAAGGLLGIGGGFVGGLFAGVGTSTPTLAAATRVTGGSTDPAVGYALTYPLGSCWASS